MPEIRFEQPARRIGGGGQRGRLGLAAWTVGLVAVAGFAVAGRLGGDDDEAPDAVAVASEVPSASGVPAVAAPPALVLTEPSAAVLSTIAVPIRGRVLEPIVSIDVLLLRNEIPIARQTFRRTRSGLFGGAFTLSAPREAGPVVVEAIGRNVDGVPVLTVRQMVEVSRLTGSAAQPTPRRRGEDGLMGSLTLDPIARAPAAFVRWSWPVGDLGWRTNPAQR